MPGSGRAGEQHRRDDMQLEHRRLLGHRTGHEFPFAGEPRVVHEKLEVRRLRDALGDTAHPFVAREVGRQDLDVHCELKRDLVGGGLQASGVACDENQVMTLLGQAPCEHVADTGGGAGHEGHCG